MERTNIYLTNEQQRRLEARARDERVTKSTIVRRILDEALAITPPQATAHEAIAASFGIWADRSEGELRDVMIWRQEGLFDRLGT